MDKGRHLSCLVLERNEKEGLRGSHDIMLLEAVVKNAGGKSGLKGLISACDKFESMQGPEGRSTRLPYSVQTREEAFCRFSVGEGRRG